jgi:predicted NUDIX family NTP pyrophosphohydrolase
MKKQSAGLLLHRSGIEGIEVFLVHPGGPFWAKKDVAAWSIPKGEFERIEDPFSAAKREFREETGMDAPEGKITELGEFKVSSSKVVHAWAIEADFDAKQVKSNTFEMEWPPKSGKTEPFPEVDKAGWFSLAVAHLKLVKGQVPLLEAFAKTVGAEIPPDRAPLEVTPAEKPVAEPKTSQSSTGGQTSLF